MNAAVGAGFGLMPIRELSFPPLRANAESLRTPSRKLFYSDRAGGDASAAAEEGDENR